MTGDIVYVIALLIWTEISPDVGRKLALLLRICSFRVSPAL